MILQTRRISVEGYMVPGLALSGGGSGVESIWLVLTGGESMWASHK